MEPMCRVIVHEDKPQEAVPNAQLQEPETGTSCVQLRTSARVYKKLKLDTQTNLTPPTTAPPPIVTNVITSNSGLIIQFRKGNDDKVIYESKPRGRRAHEVWSAEDKNAFFEALNEYGKDFDAIQQHIGSKAKKRGEQVFKNRNQARHFYHRTWHKISKHLKFPDGLKKATKELYGLINFGEFRKKVGYVSEKNSVKLNEMVYFGSTQVRIKGKTFRIKTPICKALRKLNEFEECTKEVKLPSRVSVELKPRHNEAWARVQSIAHNPRVQTEIPLNYRLCSLIKFFQSKWRLPDSKYREKLITSSSLTQTSALPSVSNPAEPSENSQEAKNVEQDDWIFCIAPKPGTQKVEASFKLSSNITSDKLSLLSHTDRLGKDYRSMLQQLQASNKGKLKVGCAKRPRTESAGDKNTTSPISTNSNGAQNKTAENDQPNSSVVTSLFSLLQSAQENGEKSPFLSMDQNQINDHQQPLAVDLDPSDDAATVFPSSLSPNLNNNNNVSNNDEWVSPVKEDFVEDSEPVASSKEKSAEILKSMETGWNLNNVGTTRIGELYVVFGRKSRLNLEYWWEKRPKIENPEEKEQCKSNESNKGPNDTSTGANNNNNVNSVQNSNVENKSLNNHDRNLTINRMATTLKRLLTLAELSLKKTKISCHCGHVCDNDQNSNNNPKSVQRRVPSKIYRSSDTFSEKMSNLSTINSSHTDNITISSTGHSQSNCSLITDLASTSSGAPLTAVIAPPNVNGASDFSILSKPVMEAMFKKPLIAPSLPKKNNSEAFKAQLDKFKLSPFCNRRGRAKKSRVVSRILPLLPKLTPKVVVVGPVGDNNYKPIAPAPQTTNAPTSISNTVTTVSLFTGINGNHQQPMNNQTKTNLTTVSALGSVNNVSSNYNFTTNTVPILFTNPSIRVASIGTPAFLENKNQTFENSANKDVTTNNMLNYSVIRNNLETINNEHTDPVSSIAPAVSSDMRNDASSNSKIFEGYLTSDDLPLLNSTTYNNSLDNNNLHNLDLDSNPPSPTRLLKDDAIVINPDDYSLSSLLGHLESPTKDDSKSSGIADDNNSLTGGNFHMFGAVNKMDENKKSETKRSSFVDDTTSLPDFHSLMCEDSLDIMGKFADLAAHINSDLCERK